MARRRKKTSSEIRREKLLEMSKDGDSLISIMINFKRKAITDRRRVVVTADKAGIDADLAKRILVEEFGWDGRDILEVSFYASRADETEQMEILFTYVEDTDDWGDKKDYTWEATARMPLMLYVAATFERYTVDMVENHVEEIKSGTYAGNRGVSIEAETYLRVIGKYNRNLPDDLKLWLELR
jgi:hypothetical protein